MTEKTPAVPPVLDPLRPVKEQLRALADALVHATPEGRGLARARLEQGLLEARKYDPLAVEGMAWMGPALARESMEPPKYPLTHALKRLRHELDAQGVGGRVEVLLPPTALGALAQEMGLDGPFKYICIPTPAGELRVGRAYALPGDSGMVREKLADSAQVTEDQPFELGDVVLCRVAGDMEVGVVTGRQDRLTPPRYLPHETYDVLFCHGTGMGQDGLEFNGCVREQTTTGEGPRPADADAVKRLREYLEARARHNDLKPKSTAALGLMRLREQAARMKKGEPEPMPTPYVVKPTLLQMVRGARVEYADADGRLHQGWVGNSGVWPDIYEPGSKAAPRVVVESTQPGVPPMSMAMPPTVLVERVQRVTCFPDPSPKPCWKCKQGGEAQGGEYPCSACGRPTMHDPVQQPVMEAAPDMGGGPERP